MFPHPHRSAVTTNRERITASSLHLIRNKRRPIGAATAAGTEATTGAFLVRRDTTRVRMVAFLIAAEAAVAITVIHTEFLALPGMIQPGVNAIRTGAD